MTTNKSLLFILPAVVFISLFMLFPAIGTFFVSFWQDVAFLPKKFIGFNNYLKLFHDTQFWQSIGFTIIFSLVSVGAEMILGMLIALVINEKFRGRGFIRGVALLPWAIPSVIGARIWQLIYRYDYGLANFLLGSPVNWLGTPFSAISSLVLADVWRTTPFVAIILLAGLQTVPEDLYKQAKIDGAGILQRFIKVTLPSIKPIIIVALLFRTIDALRVFDIIYIITGGGPGGATNSISLYSYKYFLLSDFGYGCAVSVVLFIIAFSIAIIYLKLGKFKTEFV